MEIAKIKEKVNSFLKQFELKAVELEAETQEETPETKETKLMVEGVTTEGVAVFSNGDAWAEGDGVFVVVDGEEVPAPDGIHTLEDGTTLTVENGTIVAVGMVEEEVAEEFNAEQSFKSLSKDLADFKQSITEMLEAQKLSKEKADEEAANAKIKELEESVAKLSNEAAAVSLNKQTKTSKPMNAPSKNAPRIAKVVYAMQNYK